MKELEDLYFTKNKPCLLLVDKNLSFDTSFKGDFNLNNETISRDSSNEFIFTGLQILDQSVFSSIKEKKFSMNKIWDSLIKKNSLIGKVSKQKFYQGKFIVEGDSAYKGTQMMIIPSKKVKPSKQVEVKEETSKGGLLQFLQANILSDTSS